LEEKQIPYEVEKVNMRCYGEKPAWFTKMVPSGLLPVVQLDGKIVTESMDIMFLLEERFPEKNPLLPSGGEEMEAVEALLGLERRLFGAWLNRLKSSWPDMGAFEKTMDQVNQALGRFGGPYFLGEKVRKTLFLNPSGLRFCSFKMTSLVDHIVKIVIQTRPNFVNKAKPPQFSVLFINWAERYSSIFKLLPLHRVLECDSEIAFFCRASSDAPNFVSHRMLFLTVAWV